MSISIQTTSRPAPQTGDFAFGEAAMARAESILAKYPEDRRASGILPLLDLAQRGSAVERHLEICRERDDLLGFVAGLIEETEK